ncbi:MAG: MASE1 domain-containing protein [Gemmatimonadaceae bacterium]
MTDAHPGSSPRVHLKTGDETRVLPLVPGLLVFIPLALAGNEMGTLLRYPELGAAVLFAPYAITTAALVASRRRDWIWYLLASIACHMVASVTQWPLTWIALADLANTARAVVAAVLLRRFLGPQLRLDTIARLLVFVVSAAVIAPAVGATIGAVNVVWHGRSATYWAPWSAWFLSNSLTALTMLPLFLVAVSGGATWRRPRLVASRSAEAMLLVSALLIVCDIAFFSNSAGGWNRNFPLYGPLPLLIWTALRFGTGGASLALATVAVAAIWGVDRGTVPFFATSVDANVLNVQLLLMLTSLPVLCIAVVASARQNAVQLYRALLASLQDHVALLDARGVVLEVNESWRRYAEIPSPCPFERVRTGDNFIDSCRDAVAELERTRAPGAPPTAERACIGVGDVLSGRQRIFEMEYEQDHDGRHEWYTMRAEALERRDGGAVVTRANITARHRAQVEIEEQRRELSHLARVAVLGQLSGALAHELRQPLSSILSNAEAARHLLRHQSPDVDELGAILQDIATEDRRAAQVIDGLRALLKRGETHMQAVDTGDLVREVLQLANAELITRRVIASAVVDENLPALLADRVQVQQVLLNLILNATEAMSTVAIGERTLLLTARATSTGDVQFSVRDGGDGIPLALIDRLFEPFVTTKSEGLGLGLSIARAIVAAHGGRIWAENNATRGATVHCLFATAPAEWASNGRAAAGHFAAAFPA